MRLAPILIYIPLLAALPHEANAYQIPPRNIDRRMLVHVGRPAAGQPLPRQDTATSASGEAETHATTAAVATSTAQQTSSEPTSTSTPASSTSTIEQQSTIPTPTTTTPPPQSTPLASSTTPTTSNPPSATQQVTPSESATVSTNSNGNLVTIVQTVFNTQATASPSTSSPPASPSSNNSSGVGTKSIAGMAVAGSLAVLGIIAFIWWKVSKKRFSGFSDGDEGAIKWPDLNDTTAMQPLPARHGGTRTGLDSEFESSQSELTHSNIAPYYDNQSAISSAADLSRGPVEHAATGTYYDATPPHPGLPGYDHNAYGVASEAGNPGDRSSGYYDPYSGPVPQAFSPQVGAEYPADLGRRSPGPNAAFDATPYGARAASPSASIAYSGRAASPGPSLGYGGPRSTSPGPNVTYGGNPTAYGGYSGRTTSPGPNVAYGGRSPSPGPNVAYGGRSASPVPNNLTNP